MRFFDQDRPLVFAHRGGAAIGPENTLVAFGRGITAGADGIELDVHLSADGVPVVHHDTTLDRTTNATGPIAARPAAELALVDAAYRFGEAEGFPLRGQGVGIPTLREVLRRYPAARTIIEMKVDAPALGRAVANEVRLASAVDRVCVAGYGSRSAAAARAALPDVACSAFLAEVRTALLRTWARWPVRDVAYGGYQVPESVGRRRVVSRRFVEYAHGAGLRVQVWTVDEEQDIRRLLGWGVDGLISNRPDVAVRVRDATCGT
ncbi:MAG: glycerophosphodiester phosphodiesterase family protein [Vicinamibacterales bacterium]